MVCGTERILQPCITNLASCFTAVIVLVALLLMGGGMALIVIGESVLHTYNNACTVISRVSVHLRVSAHPDF